MSKKTGRKRAGRRIYTLGDYLTARMKAAGVTVPREPSLTFKGRTRDDWRSWRGKSRTAMKRSLGAFPRKVPLKAEVLERKRFKTYIREKIVFDSEKFMSVPAWVCSPVGRMRGQKFPAVLCSPGPGPGKDPLVGLNEGEECIEYHKLVLLRLAERGYVAIAPDWRGFGERAGGPPSNICPPYMPNALDFARRQFGITLPGTNVWDGMRCIDYLVSRRDVDGQRVGCIGICFGGTLAAFISAFDERILATCLSGCLGSTSNTVLCGGLGQSVEEASVEFLKYGDTSDVAGLIAPRPLLVQIGEYDVHLDSAAALRAFRHLKRIYRAADAEGELELDFFDGGYELNLPPIFDFLERRLKK
jgi:hypothetical protein